MSPNRDSELHTHPCAHCRTPCECWGELIPDVDRFPFVLCRLYHLGSGQIDPDYLCDACRRLADAARVLRTP